jgi:fructokinase
MTDAPSEDGDWLYGGIEAGGTKFVCGVGRGPADLRIGGKSDGAPTANRREFSTADGPERVLADVVAWFREREAHAGRPLAAIGVASFGPVELDPRRANYGSITNTPKVAWRGVNLLEPLLAAFGADFPLGFDTYVNGAALGERRWGAARGLDDFVYVTMGTGIGGGAICGGQLVHGLVHPEMGHLLLPRIAGDDFPGVCPFHGACWEGLCSGPAIAARAGRPAEELDADDLAWDYAAGYTALALANLVCTLSPRRIILGGSVRKAGPLGEAAFFQRVRAEMQAALARYVVAEELEAGIDEYVVPAALGDDAGLCGAVALARLAAGR